MFLVFYCCVQFQNNNVLARDHLLGFNPPLTESHLGMTWEWPPQWQFSYKVSGWASSTVETTWKHARFCKKKYVRIFLMAGLLYTIWSYFPWDACSTTVQHGNWLKNIPWKDHFLWFSCQNSPVQKSKFCNINFWIGNDPAPPSELFRKFIRFGVGRLP